MGTAFLAGHTAIEQGALTKNAAYMAGWIRTLKRDVVW
jgi:hypothetical protein